MTFKYNMSTLYTVFRMLLIVRRWKVIPFKQSLDSQIFNAIALSLYRH